MKYLISILFVIAILYSCKDKKNDYVLNETIIVKKYIDFNLYKIEEKMILNPGMAAPYFYFSKQLTTNFDSLIYFLNQKKYNNVHIELNKLSHTIKSDFYFNSKYINKIVIPFRLNKLLSDENNGSYLNNIELFKLDLLNLENELTGFLYNSIQVDYYKFNKLMAIVADSSANIKVGEKYVANIYLAAFDTTMCPSIMVADYSQPDSILLSEKADNKRIFNLKVEGERGTYKEIARTTGKHGYKGVIRIPNSKGQLERFRFQKEFNVRK